MPPQFGHLRLLDRIFFFFISINLESLPRAVAGNFHFLFAHGLARSEVCAGEGECDVASLQPIMKPV